MRDVVRGVFIGCLVGCVILFALFWLANPTHEQSDRHEIVPEQEVGVVLETVATSTRIAFTGDIFLGRDVERRMGRFGYDYPYQSISAWWQQHDAVVANFEGAIPAQHIPTPDFGMQFSISATTIPALSEAGVTHVSLANNHALDYGADGYVNTQAILETNNIISFGHPTRVAPDISVTTLDSVVGPLAIVGIHTLFTTPTTEDIQQVFDSVDNEAEFVIAYIHWGNEYELTSSQAQKDLAHKLVAIGFDLIIGHHPHVVQEISSIDGVPVIYSLGNTIFDQYFSTDVQTGLLLTLEISDEQKTIELLPITSIGSRNQPRQMSENERELFLNEIALRSDAAIREAVRSGYIPF